MAKVILDLPEEVIESILAFCRTWTHPSVKDTGAVAVDFDTYSDFHLRLDIAEFIPVLQTCKLFYRIGLPLAYKYVSLVEPFLLPCSSKTFLEHHIRHPSTLPWDDKEGPWPIHENHDHTIGEVGVPSPRRWKFRCPGRPAIAERCTALRIDPRAPCS